MFLLQFPFFWLLLDNVFALILAYKFFGWYANFYYSTSANSEYKIFYILFKIIQILKVIYFSHLLTLVMTHWVRWEMQFAFISTLPLRSILSQFVLIMNWCFRSFFYQSLTFGLHSSSLKTCFWHFLQFYNHINKNCLSFTLFYWSHFICSTVSLFLNSFFIQFPTELQKQLFDNSCFRKCTGTVFLVSMWLYINWKYWFLNIFHWNF